MSTGAATVSVIVPCYNARRWLLECLASALSNPRVLELILVDDGSSDHPESVVEQLPVGSRSRIRQVRQPNAGAAATRDRGQQLAGGDWLIFLDADDVLRPTAIDELLERAADVDAVYGNVAIIDERGSIVGSRDQRPPVGHPIADLLFRAPLTSSVLLRRCRVGRFWSPAHQAVDEFFYFARQSISGVTFRHIPSVVLEYRHHDAVTRLTNQGFDYPSALGRAFLELHDALDPAQREDRRLTALLRWIFLDLGLRADSESLRNELLLRAMHGHGPPWQELPFALAWYGPRRVARMMRAAWAQYRVAGRR